MRVCEIDCTDDEVWVYKPPKHKNSWRDHDRHIFLGKPEQEILKCRMVGKKPDEYVFTPIEAMREKWERDAINRKTKVQPSQKVRKDKRAANPKCKYRESYNATSYGRSIKRTLTAVNKQLPDDKKIQHWTPYQLRHAAVTELAGTTGAGLDMARAVAGQKSLNTTQGYNHADEKIAIKAAKNRHNSLK